jgi:hypothetical protein
MRHLLIELLICAGMTVGMAITHMMGLMGLTNLVRYHIRHWIVGRPMLDRVAVPMTMVCGLFLLHGLEIWIYAFVHLALTGMPFEQALYGSVAAYTTVDIQALDDFRAWRLVAAHEALVGMLLIGWSTAFLFATLHRIMNTDETHPLPEGAIAEPLEEDEEPVAS